MKFYTVNKFNDIKIGKLKKIKNRSNFEIKLILMPYSIENEEGVAAYPYGLMGEDINNHILVTAFISYDLSKDAYILLDNLIDKLIGINILPINIIVDERELSFY